MDVSWFALYFLSFAWTAGIHIYEAPKPGLCCLFFAVAMALAYREQKRGGMPGAYRRTFIFCFSLLSAQLLLFPFYRMSAARLHEEKIFAAGAGLILRLCGVKNASEGCMLYIDGALGTSAILSTWEKAGVFYVLLFLTAGFLNLRFKRAGKKSYLVFSLFSLVYAMLRYGFLLALYTGYGLSGIFWERQITMLSFAPYALLLCALFRKLPPAVSLPLLFAKRMEAAEKRAQALPFLFSFLFLFSKTAFFGFRDFGREKAGRLLVDEYHSDWEWTTKAYDEEWFGERSGYNYYCFYELLDHYFEAERSTKPVDSETLKEKDIFIIKTPTKAFSDEEIGYIRDFVENGGGLYLIGDHTNVFGTGSNLNQIAKEFGLRFNYDSTYELREGNLSEYDAPRILPHPILLGFPHFLFATSDTLEAKWQAEEIMIGYGLNCAEADYSQDNFFPEDPQMPTNRFGWFLQCAGVYHKKGRVIAFTDSTVFSNFWMFMPGKPELLLRSAAWLNRENLLPAAPRELVLSFAFVLFFLYLAWRFRRKDQPTPEAYLAGGISGFLIALIAFGGLSREALEEPVPRRPMTRISFEREYSRFALPDGIEGFMSEASRKLDTFYVWTQRIGCFPCVSEELTDALSKAEDGLVVLAKPSRELEERDRKELLSRAADGARVLILDNTAAGGYSNSLLREAGMEIVEKDMAAHADYGELEEIPLSEDASSVLGGEALMRDGEGNPVLAVMEYGDGLLAVFSDPDLFYNRELGDVSANLNEKTRLLSRLEFQLLRDLLER